MRVGFFTYGMDRALTGIGRYTVELTRALRALGVEVILLSPYPDSELPWYQEFPVFSLPHLSRIDRAASLGNLELHQAAQALKLDVLHDPCGIAPFIAPRGNYSRVTTVHDAVPVVYPATQPLATRLIFRTLIPLSRFTADAVLTASEASARDLHRLLGLPEKQIHVTLCGVRPPAPYSPSSIQETLKRLGVSPRYLLYVGALHPRKNLGGVLGAYAQLRAQLAGGPDADVTLLIVGPASWGYEAHAHLSQEHSFEGVQFTGYVSDEDLGALYAGTLGLVYPSYYEGFGLPALEGMAHGAPVITSNTSSLPEVVGDAALSTAPEDTAAIARAMQRLVTEPELRAQLAAAGRARAQTFTWERTAQQTLAVYEQVLQQRRGAAKTKVPSAAKH